MRFLAALPAYDSMTPELWVTLFVGLFGAGAALGGVTLQRHFERQERRDEQAKQLNEIALALLLEIAGFYKDFAEDVVRRISGVEPSEVDRITLNSPPGNPFPVYGANAYRIGEFKKPEVEALISFHNFAESYLCSLRSSVESQNQLKLNIANPYFWTAANANISHVREILPKVDRLAKKAASALASRANVHFDPDAFEIVVD